MHDEYEDDGDASCDALLRCRVVFCGEEEMFGGDAQCACVLGLFNLIHCNGGGGGLLSGCRRGFCRGIRGNVVHE